MTAVAGIHDLREFGAPGDMGVFQLPCSYLVFPFTFSGVSYYVAINGSTGQSTVTSGADISLLISSLNNLIFLRPGSYIFTGPVIMKTDMYIVGENRDNVSCHFYGSDGFTADTKQNLRIESIRLFQHIAGSYGIHLVACNQVFINRMIIDNFNANILIEWSYSIFIYENTCGGNVGSDIYLSHSHNIHLRANDVGYSATTHAIVFNACDHIWSVEDFVEGGATGSPEGILINDSNYCYVIRGHFAPINKGGIGQAIIEAGTSDHNIIENNDVTGSSTTIIIVGANTLVRANPGYNPRGNIANPYSVAAGLILDVSAAQAFPTSATNYTVAASPKLITIYGGTITSVSIDGVATGQAGAATFAAYRLEPGQILNVVWAVQPASEVYAC